MIQLFHYLNFGYHQADDVSIISYLDCIYKAHLELCMMPQVAQITQLLATRETIGSDIRPFSFKTF